MSSGIRPNPILGAKCGSTFIDRHFLIWIEKRLGEENWLNLAGGSLSNDIGTHSVLNPSLRALMKQFVRMKENYTGNATDSKFSIELPGTLYGHTDPSRGIEEGLIEMTEYATFHF